MPDMLQGPCDGGLETGHLPWAPDGGLLITGVTKSTLPLIDWMLGKKCLGAAYLIFSNGAHNVQCFQIRAQSAPNTSHKATLEQRDHSAKDQPACISKKVSFGEFSFKKEKKLFFLKKDFFFWGKKKKISVYIAIVCMNVLLWFTFSLASNCRFFPGVEEKCSSRDTSDSARSPCLTQRSVLPSELQEAGSLGKVPVKQSYRCSNHFSGF